jgi:hypothetical protein
MPNPIGGGYQVPGDLGQRLAGTEKAVAQLQRIMTEPPKTEKPAGGGIADIASVYTTDYVGIQWPSGDPQLNFGSAVYAAPEYHEAGASWLTVTGGDIAVTEAGYYQAWCFVDLRWSSAAAAPGQSLALFLNGDMSIPVAEYRPIHKAGLLWGVVAYVKPGVEYMTAGQYWRLEADGDGASSAAITKAAASWRIAKYA